MPDRIEKGVVATIHYKLYMADDTEMIEETEADFPMVYLHGYGEIIPGLEQGLAGLAAGERKTITMTAAEAYGDYNDEDIEELDLDELPLEVEPEVGMVLEVIDEDDNESLATVLEIHEGTVVLDFNHPLAGLDLRFEVEVVSLRDASQEEIEQGAANYPDHYYES